MRTYKQLALLVMVFFNASIIAIINDVGSVINGSTLSGIEKVKKTGMRKRVAGKRSSRARRRNGNRRAYPASSAYYGGSLTA